MLVLCVRAVFKNANPMFVWLLFLPLAGAANCYTEAFRPVGALRPNPGGRGAPRIYSSKSLVAHVERDVGRGGRVVSCSGHKPEACLKILSNSCGPTTPTKTRTVAGYLDTSGKYFHFIYRERQGWQHRNGFGAQVTAVARATSLGPPATLRSRTGRIRYNQLVLMACV